MNPERFKQIDELFDQVLDVPEAEREAFLSARANGDEALKREVLRLLRAQARSPRFLEKSAMGIAARRLAAAAPPDASRFLGWTIGTYRIEKMIGAGGMGEVYLASDAKLARQIALKILPAEFTADDERVRRFRLEARTISLLNHPNIVTIFDVGAAAGINYIATEFVEGQNLRELARGGIKIEKALDIFIQVCEALAVAHRAGVVHRDIKPENIMLRPDGYVKVLDFGLAKLNAPDASAFGDIAKTSKGTVIGTPAYMSPEQVGGDAVDYRTDTRSVGVCLYELLTGINPFKKESRRATFQAIFDGHAPRPSSLNQEISPELDRILLKALEKNAELRYQTAADLRADLKRVRRALDLPPAGPVPAIEREKTSSARNRLVPATVFLMLVLTAAAGWFYFNRSARPVAGEAAEWATAQNTQLTVSPWAENYPSFSPDGKTIVFAAESEGKSKIYLQRIGGRNLQSLSLDPEATDTMPVYSPDGKSIAFRSQRGQERGIYVMEETGENLRRVSDFGFHPSWSPDNRKLVVSDRPSAIHTSYTVPNSRLWIIDRASGEKQPIETGGDAIMPSWSPNGHRIAFWFIGGGNSGEIATVPAGGGERVVIASEAAAAEWNPVWSPDGKYLYFASNRKGNMNFWRVAIDEKTGRQLGEPESVSTPSKYCRHLAVSRDGKRLAYVRYESKSNLKTIAFDPKTLKTAGDVNWVTRGDIEISNPQLSPNGEEFLIRHPDNVQEDLAVFDKNGGNWRSLTRDRFHERNPRWSPDGKRIAFQTDRSGKYQIWLMEADGSGARQITYTEKTGASLPVFAPDGKRLAYTEMDGNARRPFVIDLTTPWEQQTPQPLPPLEADVHVTPVDWSKDGKKLLVGFFRAGGDESGIALYDFASASYEKITDAGSLPFWLNDNRHFIFASRNAIYLGDTATKKTVELYRPPAYELQHAAVSPDNRAIYFRYLQIDADVWLMNAQPDEK